MKITRPITLLILFGIGYLAICSLLIHNYLIGEKTPFSVLLFFSLPAFTSIAIHRKGHSNPTAHAFYVIKKPMLIITTGGFFITLLIGFITGMVNLLASIFYLFLLGLVFFTIWKKE